MQVITRICFVFLFAAAAFGQTTFGSITGSVSDATGAVVTGARITATHLGSNYAYTAESNAAGNFNLANLREGEYSIRVHAQGFKEAVIPKLPLASLDVRRVDIQLEVGAVETSVEVSAGATLIETETRASATTRMRCN